MDCFGQVIVREDQRLVLHVVIELQQLLHQSFSCLLEMLPDDVDLSVAHLPLLSELGHGGEGGLAVGPQCREIILELWRHCIGFLVNLHLLIKDRLLLLFQFLIVDLENGFVLGWRRFKMPLLLLWALMSK